MPPRREPLPSIASIAHQLSPKAKRAMRRVARRHGPLGIASVDQRTDAWCGPVVRRDPRDYQRQTSVGIVRCTTCRHWRDEDLTVRCGTCGLFGSNQL